MMSNEEYLERTKQFVKEIYATRTTEKAREIDRRLKQFYKENGVRDEYNQVLIEGVGEGLYMLCAYGII